MNGPKCEARRDRGGQTLFLGAFAARSSSHSALSLSFCRCFALHRSASARLALGTPSPARSAVVPGFSWHDLKIAAST